MIVLMAGFYALILVLGILAWVLVIIPWPIKKGTEHLNKLWLLLLMVTPLQLIHAQKVHHAPTVAQCQADQRLWLDNKLEQAPAGLADVSYSELDAWQNEMHDCMAVDPLNNSKYYNIFSEAMTAQNVRLEDFLYLHNLWAQFEAEDAQGKR